MILGMTHDLEPQIRAQRQGDFTNNPLKLPSLELVAWVVDTFPFCCHVDSTLVRGWSYDLGMKWGMMTLQIVHQMFVIIVLLRKRRCVGKQFLKTHYYHQFLKCGDFLNFKNLCCPLHLFRKIVFLWSHTQRQYTWLQIHWTKNFFPPNAKVAFGGPSYEWNEHMKSIEHQKNG